MSGWYQRGVPVTGRHLAVPENGGERVTVSGNEGAA